MVFVAEDGFFLFTHPTGLKFAIWETAFDYGLDGILSSIAYGYFQARFFEGCGFRRVLISPNGLEPLVIEWIQWMRNSQLNGRMIDSYRAIYASKGFDV